MRTRTLNIAFYNRTSTETAQLRSTSQGIIKIVSLCASPSASLFYQHISVTLSNTDTMATVTAPYKNSEILSPEVLQFLGVLHKTFEVRRQDLLQARVARQAALDNGQLPDFLPETAHVRNDDTWKAAPIGPGLQDRRLEITGPVDRKLVINALNSGSNIFMADFEGRYKIKSVCMHDTFPHCSFSPIDSTAPTWDNIINGQVNLADAVRNQIEFVNPNGKTYSLTDKGKQTILMVR